MRTMKDSNIDWIGSIPDSWQLSQTRRLFEFTKRIVGSDADKYDRLALTLNGVIKRSKNDSEGLQPERFEGYQILKENELVFKMIDLNNVNTSRVGLSKYTGLVSPAYIILKNNCTDNRYPYYWFLSMYYNEVFNHIGGDGVRSALNAKDMLSLPIPVLSEVEKKEIADYLESKCTNIDSVISTQRQLIIKLKEYKLSTITEVVTKGLDPSVEMKDSGYDFIGSIPKDWEVCRVRNIGTLQNGISKGAEFFGHGYPFVSYGDVYRNFSLPNNVTGLIDSSDEEQKNYSVKKGDIFFTRTSETIEEVGFSAVCEQTIPNATFAGFVIRLRPTSDLLETRFAKYFFRSSHNREYLSKEMNLVTRASLGQDLLKSMPVLIPPKYEQKLMADYLDRKCLAIDTRISTISSMMEKLLCYKKSLVYEVVTGKREVSS